MTEQVFYVRNREHLVAELAGEAVVLHAKTGRYYGLNASGKLLWQLLDNPQTETNLVRALEEAFEVSPEAAENDVAKWISLLRDAGLVCEIH
jgi:hypothetical protein